MSGLVSIITPTFNNAPTLKEAGESVLAQTHTHWEWIIVDNGSTDATAEVLRLFEQDQRIKIIRFEENRGVSAARNAGLDIAQGDMFCFLDADDRLTPHSLHLRLDILHKHPEVSFVDGAVQRFDREGNKALKTPQFNGKPFKELLSLSGRCFSGVTWMVRKNPSRKYAFKEGLSHGEDLLFYLEIAEDGEYRSITEVIYDYRITEGSAMSKLIQLEEGYRAIEHTLATWPQVTKLEVERFHENWRYIMLKSYAKQGWWKAFLKLLIR